MKTDNILARDNQHFTISQQAFDWLELMAPQCIMGPHGGGVV